MEFKEFENLAMVMKAAYTSDKFLKDVYSIKLWYSLLKDIPYDVATSTVQHLILNNKYPPTIAEFREDASNMTLDIGGDWSEGWQSVISAIGRFGYTNQSGALESMTATTRACVERIGWENICFSENIQVDRANFRNIYGSIQERKKQQHKLPQKLQNTIEQLKSSTQLENKEPKQIEKSNDIAREVQIELNCDTEYNKLDYKVKSIIPESQYEELKTKTRAEVKQIVTEAVNNLNGKTFIETK